MTYKKGGIDCFRHYEILANNSIPYFLNINKIPKYTMFNYPKKIIYEIMEKLKNKKLNKEDYLNYINQLHNYTVNNLTCEKSAEYVINIIKKINKINKKDKNLKILFLTGYQNNYSVLCLSYGLRKKLQNNFIDYPKLDYLYQKKQFNLNLDDNIEIDRNNVLEKIKDHYYDFVFFGSVGPDENQIVLKYESIVNKYYKKTETIYIFGGDRPINLNYNNFLKYYFLNKLKRGICFVRELNINNYNFSNHQSFHEYQKKQIIPETNNKIIYSNNIISQFNKIYNNTLSS